jgi:hypothetical protein
MHEKSVWQVPRHRQLSHGGGKKRDIHVFLKGCLKGRKNMDVPFSLPGKVETFVIGG